MSDKQIIPFYEWLGGRFTDLQTAKDFYIEWRLTEDGETIYGDLSCRAMAYHISNVLEGNDADVNGCTDYTTTKYGHDIFWS